MLKKYLSPYPPPGCILTRILWAGPRNPTEARIARIYISESSAAIKRYKRRLRMPRSPKYRSGIRVVRGFYDRELDADEVPRLSEVGDE